jgi:hypothetical protein
MVRAARQQAGDQCSILGKGGLDIAQRIEYALAYILRYIKKLISYIYLTHFLPIKLCTTYSYAQVKFEKNEWCHKKNH